MVPQPVKSRASIERKDSDNCPNVSKNQEIHEEPSEELCLNKRFKLKIGKHQSGTKVGLFLGYDSLTQSDVAIKLVIQFPYLINYSSLEAKTKRQANQTCNFIIRRRKPFYGSGVKMVTLTFSNGDRVPQDTGQWLRR